VQPDVKIFWLPFAIRAIRSLLQDNVYQVLLTSSPPHSTHLIGRSLAKQYGIKWIADFRDGWAGSHVVREPTIGHHLLNKHWQNSVVKCADAVVTVSPGIEKSFESAKSDKFYLIPNGFDPDDYLSEISRSSKYTLCYSGTINTFAHPETFLRALAIIKRNHPKIYSKLEVVFLGYDTLGTLQHLINVYGLEDAVKTFGHQDHPTAVRNLQRADALLLIALGRDVDTFIPGKTFEYLGAQKPIFAISNSRYTNDLLSHYSRAFIVPPKNPAEIAEKFAEFFHTKWDSINIDAAWINTYNRRQQTKTLASILDEIYD